MSHVEDMYDKCCADQTTLCSTALRIVLIITLLYVGISHCKRPPNFVVILVDDLDAKLGSTSPKYMPALNDHIINQGLTFDNYFVSTPICCPSRVNLLFGQYSHITNFTDVLPPHGGWSVSTTYHKMSSPRSLPTSHDAAHLCSVRGGYMHTNCNAEWLVLIATVFAILPVAARFIRPSVSHGCCC